MFFGYRSSCLKLRLSKQKSGAQEKNLSEWLARGTVDAGC